MKKLKEIKDWKEMINQIICGDCLEGMKIIPDESIDLILTDLPYGITRCEWDSIISFKLMWKQLNRIIKLNGAIVMTANQPFTTALINSNIKMFKYCWIWEKPNAKGHLNAKKRPLNAHEEIVVFYKNLPTYNPQMTYGRVRKTATKDKKLTSEVYNKNTKTTKYDSTNRYPRSIQVFKQDTQKSKLHPTQKPLKMMEYFIKTYSNENDLILDFCMGSGTTGVACKKLNRNFIGIEINEEYCKIGEERLKQEVMS